MRFNRGAQAAVNAVVVTIAAAAAITIPLIARGALALATECAPIYVDVRALPSAFQVDVRGAAGRVSTASGIPFVFDAHPDAVVIIASPSQMTLDGKPLAASTVAAADSPIEVTLFTKRPREHGLERRNQWGGVLMHELAHVVGLTHSADINDVMYMAAKPLPAVWSTRDARRLAKVGTARGCTAPASAPTSSPRS